ncbi:MAG: nickel pincer cofactor-dependent isomerase, group 22 [Acidimicrobiales bacterium]
MEAQPRYPKVVRVAQEVSGPVVADVAGEVERGLRSLDLGRRVRAGQTVAVGAGSRGISGIRDVLQAVVGHLKGLGAEPFVVPAMGSHGGGTAEGQRKVLASYGITEAVLGCPIRSSMDVIDLGPSARGIPLWQDQAAAGADHLILCNRVKPHTMFTGAVESGLVKMLMIGLGKEKGASVCHRAVMDLGWPGMVEDLAPPLINRSRLLAGVGLVERADEQTARVAVLPPERWMAEEPELLAEARLLMPRLPFDEIDLLMLDRIGKNISGAGMDTNVIGRKDTTHPAAHHPGVPVRLIAIRGLTPETGGNAIGLGLAEFARSRVLEAMDTRITRLNALTAGDPPGAMLPVDFETDAEILDVALAMAGLRRPDQARLVWAPNTLDLRHTICSVGLAAGARDGVEVIGEPFDLPLDARGNLVDDLSDVWDDPT